VRRWLAPALLLFCACIVQKLSSWHLTGPVPSDADGFSNAIYQASGVKLVPGNLVEPANDGKVFDLLVDDLKAARQSIEIVIFIWRPGDPGDRLLEAIRERAKAGVQCRIVADAMGSNGFAEQVQPALEGAGCQVRLARDRLTWSRNHRKIFVIDGRVAYTGGVGIGREWAGGAVNQKEWRDSNVRVRGPVVEQLQRAFAESWLEEAAALVPPGSFPEPEKAGDMKAAFVPSSASNTLTEAERLTQLVIASAKKRAWVGNAYFVPSPGLKALLQAKAREGVDVRIMGPGDTTDHPEILLVQRRHYESLREAGARIFEYGASMYHAKTMLVDDAIAVVGSINIDALSQDVLDEGTLVVHDEGFAKQLEQAWLDDEKRCTEVRP